MVVFVEHLLFLVDLIAYCKLNLANRSGSYPGIYQNISSSLVESIFESYNSKILLIVLKLISIFIQKLQLIHKPNYLALSRRAFAPQKVRDSEGNKVYAIQLCSRIYLRKLILLNSFLICSQRSSK